MRQTRWGWTGLALAPWCLGAGLMLTATASAGPEPSMAAQAKEFGGKVVLVDYAPTGSVGNAAGLGSSAPLQAVPAEGAARIAFKSPAGPEPAIDETGRGDPFIQLRPELNARLGGGRTAGVGSGASTGAADGGAHYLQSLRFGDGSTPAVAAAEALATATPATEDDLPIMAGPAPGAAPAAPAKPIVAAVKPAAPAKPGTTIALPAHPNFASLIAPRLMARETYCLAQAVYFESRSEPVAGQAAVAQVVLNRLRSGLYPRSVCGVVFQNANVYLGCQFTFACEGKKLIVLEPAAWALATRVAKAAIAGANYNPLVGDAVNYHANYVRPYWARYMRRKDQIGHHIFYANPG